MKFDLFLNSLIARAVAVSREILPWGPVDSRGLGQDDRFLIRLPFAFSPWVEGRRELKNHFIYEHRYHILIHSEVM